MEKRIWTLLALQLTGEASSKELEELQKILTNDPALTKAAAEIKKIWHDRNNREMHNAFSSFAKIDKQIQKTTGLPAVHNAGASITPLYSPFRKFRKAIAVMAFIILLPGLWFIFRSNPRLRGSNQPTTALHEISTSSKLIRKASLPDGSLVHLNEKSRITYNDAFNSRYRQVWLTGEAFFDIAENKEKPFIIHAGKVNIKALGTAFNVRSYQDEQNVETSLIHGSVEITVNDDPSQKYLLVPNQKLIIPIVTDNAANSSVILSTIDETGYSYIKSVNDVYTADSVTAGLSWMQGKLVFEETSFKDLSLRLGKKFNVSFVFENKSKEQLEFTGVFIKQNLKEILQRLSMAASFSYHIKDTIVYIQ